MTAGIAAVNDRRNTAPEFPIHECPPRLSVEPCGSRPRYSHHADDRARRVHLELQIVIVLTFLMYFR